MSFIHPHCFINHQVERLSSRTGFSISYEEKRGNGFQRPFHPYPAQHNTDGLSSPIAECSSCPCSTYPEARRAYTLTYPSPDKGVRLRLGQALIVDVPEPQEYAAGHVSGAINIPRGVLECEIWNHIGFPGSTQMDRPIVLQCQIGNRTSLATQSLDDFWLTHTTAVVMSLGDWQKAGHPFVRCVSVRLKSVAGTHLLLPIDTSCSCSEK